MTEVTEKIIQDSVVDQETKDMLLALNELLDSKVKNGEQALKFGLVCLSVAGPLLQEASGTSRAIQYLQETAKMLLTIETLTENNLT